MSCGIYGKPHGKNVLRNGTLEIGVLHHNKALTHSPLSVQKFLARNSMTVAPTAYTPHI
jgi:hypothetical protein